MCRNQTHGGSNKTGHVVSYVCHITLSRIGKKDGGKFFFLFFIFLINNIKE
jgi:hypothetical protein